MSASMCFSQLGWLFQVADSSIDVQNAPSYSQAKPPCSTTCKHMKTKPGTYVLHAAKASALLVVSVSLTLPEVIFWPHLRPCCSLQMLTSVMLTQRRQGFCDANIAYTPHGKQPSCSAMWLNIMTPNDLSAMPAPNAPRHSTLHATFASISAVSRLILGAFLKTARIAIWLFLLNFHDY